MTSRSNPFKPGFGNSPAVLAGRDDIVELLAESLDNGPGALGRATLYTGARGTGKTVMLNEAADVARRRGWLVIEETASRGFVRRLVTEHLPALLAEIDPQGTPGAADRGDGATRMGPASTGSRATPTRSAPDCATSSSWPATLLAETGTGLLVTLDEVHLRQDRRAARLLRRRAAPVPQRPRDRRRRGRPAVGGQQPAQRPTCSRSCDAPTATRSAASVSARSPGRSPRRSRVAAGRSPPDVAELAAEATGGYPFLIQLVGYSVWRQRPDAADDHDRRRRASAPAEALRRMGRLVHEPALADLSDVDRAFVQAMSLDHGVLAGRPISPSASVSTRATSASTGRRLIDALLIEPAGQGSVRFTLPYLAEHLRAHADSAPARPRKAS